MAVTSQDLQNDVTAQFDRQRGRAAQQERGNQAAAQEALRRRAAAMPGAPGGAFVKQEQLANDESANRLAQANEGIDANQNAALGQLRQTQQAQDFSANQAQLGRDFSKSERIGSQDFSSTQAQLGRDFTHGERLGTQEWQQGRQRIRTKYENKHRGRHD